MAGIRTTLKNHVEKESGIEFKDFINLAQMSVK